MQYKTFGFFDQDSNFLVNGEIRLSNDSEKFKYQLSDEPDKSATTYKAPAFGSFKYNDSDCSIDVIFQEAEEEK